MPADFNGIQTTNTRGYSVDDILKIDKRLAGLPLVQRAALLGTIIEESGGDPFSSSKGGTYQGLLQWSDKRYRPKSTNRNKELQNQIDYILSTTKGFGDEVSWAKGDTGLISSGKEAHDTFNNPDATLAEAVKALNLGYVRPLGGVESYKNRLKTGRQVLNRLVQDKYKAPTPSKVPKYSFKSFEYKPKSKFQYSEGGELETKDWNSLSLRDKADIIKVAINNGITTMPEIREAYNKFAEGGNKRDYATWRALMQKHYGFDVGDPNSDYDMEAYYNRHTDEAWDRLNKKPYHFNDGDEYGTFKTLNHPTYPDRGDTSWNKEETIFYPSERQMEDSDRILDYLGSDFGYNNGSTGVSYDDSIVLPTVYSTPQGGYTDLRRNRLNTGWVYSDRSNEYAEGGNLFKDGGNSLYADLEKSLSKYEGKSMTQSYIDPLSHKLVGKNNSIQNEDKAFLATLSKDTREKVLANPDLHKWLLHYSYNIGAGKFKSRTAPTVEKYFKGKATANDVANSMWASGDKKLRGLQKRRAEEKAGVLTALGSHVNPSQYILPQGFFDDINTQIADIPSMSVQNNSIMDVDPATAYKAPIIDETLFKQQPSTAVEEVYNPMQEKRDKLQSINNLFALLGQESPLQEVSNILNYDNPLMAIASMG